MGRGAGIWEEDLWVDGNVLMLSCLLGYRCETTTRLGNESGFGSDDRIIAL